MLRVHAIACALALVGAACVDLTRPHARPDGGRDAGAAGSAGTDANRDMADGPADRPDMGPDRSPDGANDVSPADVVPEAPPSTLGNGLVGYWKLDTRSGGLAADSSGMGNTGTIEGTPALAVTNLPVLQFSNSAAFDFTSSLDDAVRIPGNAALRPTDELSVALWIRFSGMNARRTCGGLPSNYQYILQRRNARGNGGNFEAFALLRQGDNTLGFVLGTNAGTRDIVSSTFGAPASGIWYHVVATFDGAQMRLYVGGELQGQPVPHPFAIQYDSDGPLFLGRSGECGDPTAVTNYDGFFNGWLDDVRVYDRVLSATEVSDLAAGKN